MSIKLEESSRKDLRHVKVFDRWNKYTISLGIGCFLGVVIFLLANPIYTLSYSAAEVKNAVAECKASVIKFVPLGAYPEGSDQVISALDYCGTLG
jgi:hypothetical protein